MPIKKVLNKENTHVLSLLIFYENRNNVMFKLLSSVFLVSQKICIYPDYMCCPQTKLNIANKGF